MLADFVTLGIFGHSHSVQFVVALQFFVAHAGTATPSFSASE